MLLLTHLREIDFDPAFCEWGDSIVHVRREKGTLWRQAADIWAAQTFFSELQDSHRVSIARLPVHVFETFQWVLDHLTPWQIRNDFSDIYPGGITREEAKTILRDLYVDRSELKDQHRHNKLVGFVYLVNDDACEPRDLRFLQKLLGLCDVDALNMPADDMRRYVELFERALRQLGARPWRLDDEEKIYVQLKFLACLHHTIVDLGHERLKSGPAEPASPEAAMLAVSAMGKKLSLDLGFYYRQPNGALDQVDLRSGDRRVAKYSCPVIGTDLPESEFLLESEEDIVACLFNHPLDVMMYEGKPRLIALDRSNCPSVITKDRTARRPGCGTLSDFLNEPFSVC